MKWIGQHIWDYISRFRNDVYLEDISTGTIASGGNLGLDSNNKIVKADTEAGELAFSGSTANGVLTYGGAAQIDVESTLTYNSVISLLTLSSTASSLPQFILSNSNTDAAGSKFKFQKTANGADDDIIGLIDWTADDDGGTALTYATIQAEIADASNNDEAGRLELKVTTNSTEHQQALTATGLGTGSRVDIGLGYGTDSTTTIAGDLQVVGGDILGPTDGDLNITSDGSIVVNVDNDNDETNQDIKFRFNGSTDGFQFNPSRGSLSQYSTSATNYPLIFLENTGDNATGVGTVQFNKKRVDTSTQVGEDNDLIGKTKYSSYNDNGTPQSITYAEVQGTIADASDSDEAGKYEVKVTTSNGTTSALQNALSAVGSPSDNDVDVTIGHGATSTTTIAGTLTMGSTAAMTNAGQLSVAAQPNITTMTGFLGGTTDALITDDGDGTVTSESSLTYNTSFGTALIMASALPQIAIRNTNNDTNGGSITLSNFRGTSLSALSANDILGQIIFSGADAGGGLTSYANIKGDVSSPTATDEAGRLYLQAATSNGTTTALQTGILLTGDPTNSEVDVSIGYGAASVTTINGHLLVEGVTQFNGQLEIGDANDTTLVRSSGGTLTVEGNTVATTNLALDSFADSTSNSIGVGNIELGHASDTTLARSAAGKVTIEGNEILTTATTEGVVRNYTTTIDQATMNALHTTAATLVASPGSGKQVLPLDCWLRVTRNTTQLNNVALSLSWNSDVSLAGAAFYQKGFMRNKTTNEFIRMVRYTNYLGNFATDDRPLTLKLTGAITSNSVTSVKVHLQYIIIDV